MAPSPLLRMPGAFWIAFVVAWRDQSDQYGSRWFPKPFPIQNKRPPRLKSLRSSFWVIPDRLPGAVVLTIKNIWKNVAIQSEQHPALTFVPETPATPSGIVGTFPNRSNTVSCAIGTGQSTEVAGGVDPCPGFRRSPPRVGFSVYRSEKKPSWSLQISILVEIGPVVFVKSIFKPIDPSLRPVL